MNKALAKQYKKKFYDLQKKQFKTENFILVPYGTGKYLALTKKKNKKKVYHYTARTKKDRERERHADYGFAAAKE